MKNNGFFLAISLYLGASTSALAGFPCHGMIDYLGMEATGGVVVALRNMTGIHYICNVDTKGSFATVPSACKATYAALQAAKALDRPVTLYYGDNGYTCSTIPSWGAAHQFYFLEQR